MWMTIPLGILPICNHIHWQFYSNRSMRSKIRSWVQMWREWTLARVLQQENERKAKSFSWGQMLQRPTPLPEMYQNFFSMFWALLSNSSIYSAYFSNKKLVKFWLTVVGLSIIDINIGLVYVWWFVFWGWENDFHKLKTIFLSPQNELSDINKAYIKINYWQKFELQYFFHCL